MPDLDETALLQGRVVHRDQALAELTRSALAWRVRSRRWRAVHRDVFCIDQGPLGPEGTAWAALLAAGRGAALSHGTAGWLWGLLDAPPALVHLTVPAGRRAVRLEGVRVHRSRLLDLAAHPAAAPRRTRLEHTVIDLVAAAPDLDSALALVAAAVQRRLTTPARLRTAVEARKAFRWRRDLVAVLVDVARGAQSLLELRYVRDVERAHGLPRGRLQSVERVAGQRVYRDVEYEDYGVCVELDGRLGHDAPRDRWRDKARDNLVAVSGRLSLRYGYADVTVRLCASAVQLAAVLTARGWAGKLRRCVRCSTP
ncbi:hypothetical protein [Motilibacter deserti]|uniref:Transcriptional regulator, AbiEi antitoxin, Type IV TA system n=1 Tax=Motilibacter deserti TaxID=2714956 RepID=A0ABX0GVJ2_9ACTN|nr:hypothetical protein [Motilibacter deserti]NHC14560.1 hypothetical protein [Motilibacter deserti]